MRSGGGAVYTQRRQRLEHDLKHSHAQRLSHAEAGNLCHAKGLASVRTTKRSSRGSLSFSFFVIAGFLRPHSHLSHPPASPEVSVALNPSQYLKNWIVNSKPAADGTTATVHRWPAGTNSAGVRVGRARTHPDSAGLGKRAQMLEMITALEELQRAVNSTLSSRITVMSRGNCVKCLTHIQACASLLGCP